jgi:hypothetical protein
LGFIQKERNEYPFWIGFSLFDEKLRGSLHTDKIRFHVVLDLSRNRPTPPNGVKAHKALTISLIELLGTHSPEKETRRKSIPD